MQFRKMHGLGNDFVILDFRKESEQLSPGQIKHICDRNFGVGCDLLTVLEPSDNADVFTHFFNADGTRSDVCGNATRCVADIIMKEQGSNDCTIETNGTIYTCSRAENNMVTVDMGLPIEIKEISSPISQLSDPVTVNMGNPHCVFFVDSLESTPVEELGPLVENDAMFPVRTNVEFVEIISDTKVRQKTWERGVGITLACGSGACATAVAGTHIGRLGRKVEIELDGGSLFIEQREEGGNILMTGPVAYVFEGALQS